MCDNFFTLKDRKYTLYFWSVHFNLYILILIYQNSSKSHPFTRASNYSKYNGLVVIELFPFVQQCHFVKEPQYMHTQKYIYTYMSCNLEGGKLPGKTK